jgi:hypothetical protein
MFGGYLNGSWDEGVNDPPPAGTGALGECWDSGRCNHSATNRVEWNTGSGG